MNLNNSRAIPTTILKVRPPYSTENFYFDTVPYGKAIRCGTNSFPHFYDTYYGSRTPQELFFIELIRSHIDKFIRGEDISVVTTGPNYGGKSYTMFGPGLHLVNSEQEYGLLPRAVSYIFNKLSGLSNMADWSLTVSIADVTTMSCRDLHTGGTCQLVVTEKGMTSMAGGKEKICELPSEVMIAIQKAMENRSVVHYRHTTSAYVKLELRLPEPSDPSGWAVSTATFIDLAHFKVETRMQVFEGDLWLLEVLAMTAGGRVNHPHLLVLKDLPIFHLLKDSFTGMVKSLVIHCLPPSAADFQITQRYLDCAKLFYECKLMLANQLTNNSGSDISFSQSLESADSLFGAMSLNREFDNDSINGQSHGQPLQCIEEVTESEEEIASSDEKMSESQDSQSSLEEDSSSESDQEDIDKVCQLSNDDFSDNLNNLCQQFYCFVDSFVESFKTKAAEIPAKERKLTCSSVRRGAMQYGTNNPLSTATSRQVSNSGLEAHLTHCPVTIRPITKKCTSKENKSNSSSSSSENEDMTHLLPAAVKDAINDQSTNPDELLQQMIYENNRLEQLINLWNRRDTKHTVSADVTELMACISANMDELYNCVGVEETGGSSMEQHKELVKHRARQYRRKKETFTVRKQQLHEKMKEQVIDENELKDFIVADEIIELIDHAIEYSSVMAKGGNTELFSYPKTQMGDMAMRELKHFSVPQLRYLLSRLFMRVVDMRGNGKAMEQSIGQLEQELRVAEQKNRWLNITMQKMRSNRINTREVVGCSTAADPPSNALALPDGRIKKLTYQNPRENKKEERGTRVFRNSKKLIILTNH